MSFNDSNLSSAIYLLLDLLLNPQYIRILLASPLISEMTGLMFWLLINTDNYNSIVLIFFGGYWYLHTTISGQILMSYWKLVSWWYSLWDFLRSMAPLAGASMLKTLLLINEFTCLLGNTMWLVVICWLSDVCPRSVRACDSIGGNGLCVRSPLAPMPHALRAI